MPDLDFVAADWPAPPNVRAMTTTRTGGVSDGRYASLNLATHVGDDAARVAANRERLSRTLGLPGEPAWLDQHHGTRILDVPSSTVRRADGAYTDRPGVVCAILTADCLPVLLCDRSGREVCALHAGWRGLAGGIVPAGIARMKASPADLIAWLGPAIGAANYEVGSEVRAEFVTTDQSLGVAFTPSRPGHHRCDLYEIARRQLAAAGVGTVTGGRHCTFAEHTRFFSYRRDGGLGDTGRIATLLWLTG
jgi:hypothetical protein